MDDEPSPQGALREPKLVAPNLPTRPSVGGGGAGGPGPPAGAYGIWIADANGDLIGHPREGRPNPADPEAVEIYFGLISGRIPPQDQSDLQISIADVLTVAQTLYIPVDGKPLPAFRLVYTRLFRIAQLGLEGDAAPQVAKAALDRVTSDLIDREGAGVKNRHLAQLGSWAAVLTVIFLVVYLLLSVLLTSPLFPALAIDPVAARGFAILWVGCFAGVWLSYAIRTTTLTLKDLTQSDSDRLLPLTRLVFAGLLTMALGLVLILGWADLKIGGLSVSALARNPTEALLVGLFCGVSELLLPGIVGKRANDFVGKLR